MSNDAPPKVAAILAEFNGPDALRAAAARVRDEGFTRWDTFSPYPVHGIERAMGLRMTRLPWLVLGAGIVGAAVAIALQWGTNAWDYPHITSGKPTFSLPANIPIAFELIVLLAAIAAFGGTLVLNWMPEFSHPVFSGKRFHRATTDGFFLAIEAADPMFNLAATEQLLKSIGACDIETCVENAEGRKFPAWVYWTLATAAVLAVLPPLLIARARSIPADRTRIHLINDMDWQPRYRPQGASAFFADGRAMRQPVAGTIADGQLEADDHLYRGKTGGQWATTFPMPVDRALMDRGRHEYGVYCAPCHGLVGEGDGMVARRALARREANWRTPMSLQMESVRKQPVGQLFDTITNGIRTMPAYGPQIAPADRWAIILYLRALQRSQNASVEDVPEEIKSQLR